VLHDYPQRCGGRYDRWNLIQAVTASAPGSAVVQLTGHPGYVRCSGPSDIAYLHHRSIEDLTLTPGAIIRVIDLTSVNRHSRSINPHRLRMYIKNHAESDFYRYEGPTNAVTKVIELYHP
jgi:hypothetical protein